MTNARQKTDQWVRMFFFSVALASIAILTMIMVFLFSEGLPIFKKVSPSGFIFGNLWYPTSSPPEFVIFPLIVASIAVTLVSAVISVPLGVMTAIYLAELAHKRVAEIMKPVVELLAALPSVVVGFFGMVVVAPFLQDVFDISTGLNLFNAALMLSFMSVPTICSLSEDAIYSVPVALKEGSLALGATHWETLIRVILPASISGISTAIILGMSRAIGETMVVLMVAGGAAMIPSSLFDPVRPMPASIAAEMAEASFRGDHYYAL
ncbi:MAG TPA: phosphate ABC transporter permease subunit PstC, partial [Desulfatirhabdiaceae bacterium]|nr:phosphate ABC transporter permease subunit PstC [Desulfatirhabdiaceae bacterium]